MNRTLILEKIQAAVTLLDANDVRRPFRYYCPMCNDVIDTESTKMTQCLELQHWALRTGEIGTFDGLTIHKLEGFPANYDMTLYVERAAHQPKRPWLRAKKGRP